MQWKHKREIEVKYKGDATLAGFKQASVKTPQDEQSPAPRTGGQALIALCQRPSQWHSQEPALAQPTATLSMVGDIFFNGSLVSTQFRDAGDLEHPQHVTLALLFYTRHFMLLCNWAMIGEILLVHHNLS